MLASLDIAKVEPFADGAAFGDAGAYERVSGTARGELDPDDRRNARIVNLRRAARNARGRVDYSFDWFMLRPVDPRKDSGTLIYDTANRGRKFILQWVLGGTATNNPMTVGDAGTGLFLRMGHTLAWSGWEADPPATDHAVLLRPPALPDVTGPVRDELVYGTRRNTRTTFRLNYEAADLDKAKAALTMRRHEGDARKTLRADQWDWVSPREIRLAAGAPEPGTLYELQYLARNPLVMGTGFAAVRDFISHVRAAQRAPRTTLALGISQGGRFLRDFVRKGFNESESGKRVFDGMMSYVGGAGGVFLDAEFAMPARTVSRHQDHRYPENWFPFSAAACTDPVSGKTAALFPHDAFAPKWMDVNSSTEYWQKGASLVHTDPAGREDLDLGESARAYFIAGTQHSGHTQTQGPCAHPVNPTSPAPALRALLVALGEWAASGKAPPRSCVPRIADGTLVDLPHLQFPAIPGVSTPSKTNHVAPLADWVRPGTETLSAYRVLVPQVNADGNELAGIHLPEVAAAKATYLGWNLYQAPYPEGEMCDRFGALIPFARTAAERRATADPRPSLEERYPTQAEYVRQVQAAADALVAQGFLLEEDARALVAAAVPLQP